MSALINLSDSIYRKLPAKAWFWCLGWASWFILLWYLSSRAPDLKNAPAIPHVDKVIHFIYFMIGAFCFSNALAIVKIKQLQSWLPIFIITLCAGALTGAIDEYHQSFVPGRSGNDLGDWTADFLGTIAGFSYCYLQWKRLKLKA